MKNKCSLLLVLAITSFLLFSCEDFIEVNLNKKYISLTSPINNYVSSDFTMTFKWEDLNGVENYRLQLFKINLSNQLLFLMDTTIHISQFSLTLDPGSYKWQVRGENNSSHTDYSAAYFKIDSTTDLSKQTVKLVTPLDNTFSDKFEQTFTWSTLPTAVSYVFQVNNEFQTVSGTTATYKFPKTGKYTWSVFAQNATSKSKTSVASITIDTIKLIPPVLKLPVNNDTNSLKQLPVQLEWYNVTNAVKYQVQISEDQTFKSGTTDFETTNTIYSVNVNKLKLIYWRIRAISITGVYGAFSSIYMFRVNN